MKKEPNPQGTTHQRTKKGRNQGEPEKRESGGRRSRRQGATESKGKEGCKKRGEAKVAGFPKKRLLWMIKALGILGEQFQESEDSKLDSQEHNAEKQRMRGQQL